MKIADNPTTATNLITSQASTTPATTRLVTNATLTAIASTTALETTTNQSSLNVCFDVYPKPAYHNRSNVVMNLLEHEFVKNVWLPGSNITFSCIHGYYPNRNIRELTITCLPNGQWSNVTDCNCLISGMFHFIYSKTSFTFSKVNYTHAGVNFLGVL